MISLYKDYLEQKLKEAGIKGKIYRSMKELKASGAIHLGAVLFEEENLERDGSKKTYIKEDGTKVKRIRKFKRTTKLSVTIGDYSEDKCEEIFANFLNAIDEGIDDGNGNFVEINIISSDWVYDKDSILRSKVAVQILIEFIGGVYEDIEFTNINQIEFTGVEFE
ncbi:hypothetical protein [Caloranaerobacter sp. DY30410]|uniref:hypothetical protein n=1 Tax=Caloranaerobacter sp. DY30410 TaxID=3238305 RepID=UPI003CFDCCA8